MTSLIIALLNTFVAGLCACGALVFALEKEWGRFALNIAFTLLNVVAAVFNITSYLGIIQL